MTFSKNRLATLLLTLALAAPAALADEHGDVQGGGDHAWTNPGEVLPCEFFSGTLTVTGLLHSEGCDPNRDTDCGLVLEVVSKKQDTVRGFLAHDVEDRCTIEVTDGRKRKLGPMWRRSEEGAKLVRVTGVVTDGVMGVSRFRILGEPDGVR